MRIRLTRYDGTDMVVVSTLRDDEDLPHEVRFVDPDVADAVEIMLRDLPFGGAAGLNPDTDIDAVLDQARAAARDRRER